MGYRELAAMDVPTVVATDDGSVGYHGTVVDALGAYDARVGPSPESVAVYTCGPTPMMLAVERHLLAAGVPAGQIVYERFEYD